MTDPITPQDEQRLAERLRREAEAERPAFSEALHRRIVGTLPTTTARPRPGGAGRRSPRRWLVAALVAGAVVGAALVLSRALDHRAQGPTAPDETAVAPPESAPENVPRPHPGAAEQAGLGPLGAVAGGSAADIDRLVDATLVKSKWAYLDHDARLAASLMLDQIPLDLSLWEEEEIEH